MGHGAEREDGARPRLDGLARGAARRPSAARTHARGAGSFDGSGYNDVVYSYGWRHLLASLCYGLVAMAPRPSSEDSEWLSPQALPASAASRELIIVSRERMDLYDELRQAAAAHVEVRIDSRVGERRRSRCRTGEDRRQRDRRTHDIRDQLQTLGWALVSPVTASDLSCGVCQRPIHTPDGYYRRHDTSYHVDCYPHRSPRHPA